MLAGRPCALSGCLHASMCHRVHERVCVRELEGSGIKGVILQHLSLSFQAQAVGRSRPDVSLPSTPPRHTHTLTNNKLSFQSACRRFKWSWKDKARPLDSLDECYAIKEIQVCII